jgi:hypothetical protein
MRAFAFCKRLVLGVILLSFFGCSGCKENRQQKPAEARLLAIGEAYLTATRQLGRPPADFEDIKPYLGKENADELMRSPNDGEPFVILWGVDFNQVAVPANDPAAVAAYEQKGVNGKRCVLRLPRNTMLVTDEQLRKLTFPPGHTPPG